MNQYDTSFSAAVVEKTIFCCHGGLSPDLHDLDQVRFYFHITCFTQSNYTSKVEHDNFLPHHRSAMRADGFIIFSLCTYCRPMIRENNIIHITVYISRET